MRKIVLSFLITLLVFSGVLTGTLAWIAGTESGLRNGYRVAALIWPGVVTVKEMHGRLAGPIELEGVHVSWAGGTVRIGSVVIQWSPLDILQGKIRIGEIKAEEIVCHIADIGENTEKVDSSVLPEVSTVVPVILEAVRIEKFSIAGPDMKSPFDLNMFFLSGTWHGAAVDIQRCLIETGRFTADVRGSFVLAGEYPLQLEAEWLADGDTPAGGVLKASGTLYSLDLRHDTDDPVTTSLKGSITDLPGVPEWEANLEVTGVDPTLPVRGFSGADVELRVHGGGSEDTYHLEIAGIISSDDIPRLEIQGKATGGLRILSLDEINLHTLGGVVRGNGSLSWEPRPEWNFSLEASGIDYGQLWKKWPGRLSAELDTEGFFDESGVNMSVDIRELNGTLMGYPLSGSCRSAWRDSVLTLTECRIASGESLLQVSGTAGRTWNIRWSLNSENVGNFLPDISGRLDMSGLLTGEGKLPDIQGNIKADRLKAPGYGIDELEGDLRLELGSGRRIKAVLQGKVLDVFNRQWQVLGLSIDGTIPKHRLDLILGGGPVGFSAVVQGGLEKGNVYHGILDSLEVNGKPGQWSLEQGTEFLIGSAVGRLDRLCLADRAGGSRGCIAMDYQGPGSWKVAGDFQEIGLAAASAFLPDQVSLDGQLNGGMDLVLEGGILSGSAAVEVTAGKVEVSHEHEQHVIPFRRASLDLKAGQKGLYGELAVPLSGMGSLEARVNLPEWRPDSPAAPEQKISAYVRMDLSDLSMLSALVPRVASIKGSAALDAEMSGTLGRVSLSGGLRSADAGFDIPALGVRIEVPELDVESPGPGRIKGSGRMRSGKGEMKVSVTSECLNEQGWKADFYLKGKDFKIVDTYEALIFVSPDLHFGVDSRGMMLTGEVLVPRARIRPVTMAEGTVAPSHDVVIEGQGVDESADNPKINVDVRVRMGEHVSFEGYGLKGGINGNLRIAQEPGKTPLGTGCLAIEDGKYRAFGLDLTVDTGKLIFSDTPLDNPGINLTASREADNISAGVRIKGTLKRPVLTVFSSPAMPQSDAIAFLFTGSRNGKYSGNNVSDRIVAAAGNYLAEKVGTIAGLDELRLETDSSAEDISLVIGKYLSPDLYLQYINEFDKMTSKIKLLYDFNENIQIQTETGTVQGVDIFYKIER